MNNLAEVVGNQNTVISIQSGIIKFIKSVYDCRGDGCTSTSGQDKYSSQINCKSVD